jgi:hypothetical protein
MKQFEEWNRESHSQVADGWLFPAHLNRLTINPMHSVDVNHGFGSMDLYILLIYGTMSSITMHEGIDENYLSSRE